MRMSFVSGLCLFAVAGCAPAPRHTEVLVGTNPPGAACIVSATGQPDVPAGPTPAIALLNPYDGPINVQCRRPGFADAAATLPATGTTATGAPSEYHRSINIPLVPVP